MTNLTCHCSHCAQTKLCYRPKEDTSFCYVTVTIERQRSIVISGCVRDELFLCRSHHKNVGGKNGTTRRYTRCCQTSLCNNETMTHRMRQHLNHEAIKGGQFTTKITELPALANPNMYPSENQQTVSAWNLSTENIAQIIVTMFLVSALVAVLAIIVKFLRVLQAPIPETMPPTRKGETMQRKQNPAAPLIAKPSLTETIVSIPTNSTTIYPNVVGLDTPMQRSYLTISQEVRLQHLLRRGRFAETWSGIWRGDVVIAKLFPDRPDSVRRWTNEKQLYELHMLRHQFLLGFIASDVLTTVNSSGVRSGRRTFYLMMQQLPLGSLHDSFTNGRAMSPADALNAVTSIAAALSFLHDEIQGQEFKPSIAHCNLTARNILLKTVDGTCCISDLGSAITAAELSRPDGLFCICCETINSERQVDQLRYTAPELLIDVLESPERTGQLRAKSPFNGTMHTAKHILADVYSFALVSWQILRRTTTNEMDGIKICDSYELPYEHDLFGNGGKFSIKQSIERIVAGNRPELPARCDNATSPLLSRIAQLTKEAWSGNPHLRPTSMRLKLAFNQLQLAHRQNDRLAEKLC